ncbi:MAG: hypothetical protein IPF54_14385 [Draconibacterium sp.]|nr:hypothetical protein [Draconibacterium sp.]
MKTRFDLDQWERVKWKLKKMYPQLTEADLIWRHESKDNLYYEIESKLVISKRVYRNC